MHKDTSVSDEEIHLKIKYFLIQTTMSSKPERPFSKWKCVRFPHIIAEEYLGRFVFRWNFIGAISSACSLITFDSQRKRLRQTKKHRIEYRICESAISNFSLRSPAMILSSFLMREFYRTEQL